MSKGWVGVDATPQAAGARPYDTARRTAVQQLLCSACGAAKPPAKYSMSQRKALPKGDKRRCKDCVSGTVHVQVGRGLAAAIPMENPYCSCKADTWRGHRARRAGRHAGFYVPAVWKELQARMRARESPARSRAGGGRVGVAVGRTVILLHPPSTFSRCFNRGTHRVSSS